MEEFLTKDIVSTGDICFSYRYIFFLEIEIIMINW